MIAARRLIPLGVALVVLNMSAAAAAPRVLEDLYGEAYRARSAPQGEAAFELALRVSAYGHFTLTGPGRTWIGAGADARNIPRFLPSRFSKLDTAMPCGAAQLQRLRAGRDGTLSVGLSIPGFCQPDGHALEDSSARRTVGVTYGRGGVSALVAVVDASLGLGDRQQVWPLHLGNTPSDAVTVSGLDVRVAPADSEHALTARVLYPATAWIEYIPPTNGQAGVLQIHREKPEASINEIFDTAFDRLEKDVARTLAGVADGDEMFALDLASFTLEEASVAFAEQPSTLRQQQELYLKLLDATSSIKMGAGDRSPCARAAWVVVMAVHGRDTAPVFTIPGRDDPALCRVGNTAIVYHEYLVEFIDGEATP